MWGPGRALRGEGLESVNYALEIMEKSVDETFICFLLGMCCYFVSSILVAWMIFSIMAALTLSIILIFMIFWIGTSLKAAYDSFSSHLVVSGRLKGNPIVTNQVGTTDPVQQDTTHPSTSLVSPRLSNGESPRGPNGRSKIFSLFSNFIERMDSTYT
eukprot:GHVL01014184.1.p1 GENE.GHVL01014184.1~~GHVL01014184.1.p1  ORF type:complete len:157 (+),score=15.26 GHVL01014184.1:200-670(+)